jgi:hypothetical protein
METLEDARRINDEVLEAAPRRLLVLLIVAMVLLAFIPLTGCGLVKFDDDQRMYGPRQTFDPRERISP